MVATYLTNTKGRQEVEISPDGEHLYLRVTRRRSNGRRKEYVSVPNSAKARLALRVWRFSFSYDPVERMMVPFVPCGTCGTCGPCGQVSGGGGVVRRTSGARRKLLLSEILLGPDYLRQIGP